MLRIPQSVQNPVFVLGLLTAALSWLVEGAGLCLHIRDLVGISEPYYLEVGTLFNLWASRSGGTERRAEKKGIWCLSTWSSAFQWGLIGIRWDSGSLWGMLPSNAGCLAFLTPRHQLLVAPRPPPMCQPKNACTYLGVSTEVILPWVEGKWEVMVNHPYYPIYTSLNLLFSPLLPSLYLYWCGIIMLKKLLFILWVPLRPKLLDPQIWRSSCKLPYQAENLSRWNPQPILCLSLSVHRWTETLFCLCLLWCLTHSRLSINICCLCK